jgi:hypothetical protein
MVTAPKKVYWNASESAPLEYPMQIIKGDLFFKDGKHLYIPDHKVVHNGWGMPNSAHVSGSYLKPIPIKLKITWFSYAENKFYTGEWDLPHQKILEMFDEPVETGIDRRRPYTEITTGLAPEGHVSVWMSAENVRTKIAEFKAQEADIAWGRLTPSTSITRAEYIAMVMEGRYSVEQLADLKENGIPPRLYERYGTKYNWKAEINVPYPFEAEGTQYLNGEASFYSYPLKEAPPSHRAPPYSIGSYWLASDGYLSGRTVYLDPREVLEVFEKMSGGDTDRPMRLRIDINQDRTAAAATLYADNLVLPLEKVTLK